MTKEFRISEKTYKRISELQSYVVFILLFFIVHSLFKVAFVPSASMYPTLAKKELLFCRYADAETMDYGDIVIFYPDDSHENLFVKRLIGKPGDTIAVHDYRLYRNGVALEEEYLMDQNIEGNFSEYVVPDDCYFFMGDNRNNSYDCRYYGAIPGRNVVGEVLFHLRIFSDENLMDVQDEISERNQIFEQAGLLDPETGRIVVK